MCGTVDDQGQLFSFISPEQRIEARHPIRTIRALVREVLSEMYRDFPHAVFPDGAPVDPPPEQLLSALLLQVLYGIRSERQLMKQLDYNLLYRTSP